MAIWLASAVDGASGAMASHSWPAPSIVLLRVLVGVLVALRLGPVCPAAYNGWLLMDDANAHVICLGGCLPAWSRGGLEADVPCMRRCLCLPELKGGDDGVRARSVPCSSLCLLTPVLQMRHMGDALTLCTPVPLVSANWPKRTGWHGLHLRACSRLEFALARLAQHASADCCVGRPHRSMCV